MEFEIILSRVCKWQTVANARVIIMMASYSPRIMVVAYNSPGWGLHLMWGIVKKTCLRGGSFALSILQIPTYAREGWGGALH